MPDGEVFNADSSRNLIVDDFIDDTREDRQYDDCDPLHLWKPAKKYDKVNGRVQRPWANDSTQHKTADRGLRLQTIVRDVLKHS